MRGRLLVDVSLCGAFFCIYRNRTWKGLISYISCLYVCKFLVRVCLAEAACDRFVRCILLRAMGKHLTAEERDYIRELVAQKKLPLEVHAKLAAKRRRRRQPPLDITTVRRHMRGKTFKAGVAETRGFSRASARARMGQCGLSTVPYVLPT